MWKSWPSSRETQFHLYRVRLRVYLNGIFHSPGSCHFFGDIAYDAMGGIKKEDRLFGFRKSEAINDTIMRWCYFHVDSISVKVCFIKIWSVDIC